jgi:hypothetical protein
LKRFPTFEASYETILHKNLPTNENYEIGLAIPFGKKYYMWFTFYQDKNVCFLMELNRDKKIIRISILHSNVPVSLALGTILFVSCINEHDSNCKEVFLIEDIYYYKGVSLDKFLFCDKLGYIEDCLKNPIEETIQIYLPQIWSITEQIPEIKYPVHHKEG